MKRLFLILGLLSAVLLCGCGRLRDSYPRLEQLRVVQTLGVDRTDTGLRLSLATAAGDRGADDAVCLSADGPTLSAALTRAESRSTEETLFCGHIRQMLIGESAPLEPLLATVCRSKDLRLDMPLYLLRGVSAEEIMSETGSGSRGITEVLDAVRGELDYRSSSRDFTVGHTLQDLQRQGCALLCVLQRSEAAERSESAESERGEEETPPAQTAALAGFAIVRGDEVLSWLGPEELLGIGLLRNSFGVQELSVTDRNGNPVSFELRQGSSRVHPVWREDGSLQGVDLSIRLKASLLETGAQPLSAPYIDDLTARLESAVAEQIRALLARAKSLQADFLGLGARLEEAAPLAFRRLEEPFPALLPKLEVSLSVQSRIEHEYDLQ